MRTKRRAWHPDQAVRQHRHQDARRHRDSRRLLRALVLLGVLFSVIAPGTRGLAAENKLAPDLIALLESTLNTTPVEVVVQTGTDPSAAISQTVLLGGQVTATWNLFYGFAATLPAGSVPLLAQHVDVSYISPDRGLVPTDTTFDYGEWAVGAPVGWADFGVDGTGIGVAVIDSGVQPHGDLADPATGASRITAWMDLVNGRSAPYDDFGHGTHVAGIVAGNGAASAAGEVTFRGVAPAARIIAVKVLDRQGFGRVSTVISGLDWVVRRQQPLGAHIVNLSLGHPVFESATRDPLARACQTAVQRGLVVVTSAGNEGDGYGGITSPGHAPSVITVGAMTTAGTPWRDDDRIAAFSSRGPTRFDELLKPDLVAPGNRIVSLRVAGAVLDQWAPENRVDPVHYGLTGEAAYFVLSGTSMAAPHVSGAAALVLQRNPGLPPNAVKAALMHSAEERAGFDPFWGDTRTYDVLTQGAGYLNVPGALEIAGAVEVTREVGADWLRVSLSYESTIAGHNVTWGRTQSWANNVTWGRGMLWGQQVLWGPLLTHHQPAFTAGVTWGHNVTWGKTGASWNAVRELEESTWGHNVTWGKTSSAQCARDVLVQGDDGS